MVIPALVVATGTAMDEVEAADAPGTEAKVDVALKLLLLESTGSADAVIAEPVPRPVAVTSPDGSVEFGSTSTRMQYPPGGPAGPTASEMLYSRVPGAVSGSTKRAALRTDRVTEAVPTS